jgi:hypothetical protein
LITPPIYYALLCVQSALVNAVAPQLRAVTVGIDEIEKKVVLYFFYDGEITEELYETASLVGTDTNHPYYRNSEHIVRLDYPKKIPIFGKLAFLRKESHLPHLIKENRSFLLAEFRPLSVYCLDMQEALLGKITPALRHVSVGIDIAQKKLIPHFIYDGKVSEDDRNLAIAAIQESRISFPEYEIGSWVERLDFPSKISVHDARAAYYRQEFKY